MEHTKKIKPGYYKNIFTGRKNWEIRKEDDCKYSVWDEISFTTLEWVSLLRIRIASYLRA